MGGLFAQREWSQVDGILNINKHCGQTSFSVVAQVRRLTGERRVGHGGTLDPAATGVLPICLVEFFYLLFQFLSLIFFSCGFVGVKSVF